MLCVLVVIFVLSTAEVSHGCENNWIGHGSSCYHFSHDTETWVDAMAVCKLLDGYLVEINDQSENNFIVNSLKYNYIWIGLTDLVEEGVWEWMTSKTRLEKSGFWAKGEPNNANNNENCALAAKAALHYGWNDGLCSSQVHYVCEKPSDGEAVVG